MNSFNFVWRAAARYPERVAAARAPGARTPSRDAMPYRQEDAA